MKAFEAIAMLQTIHDVNNNEIPHFIIAPEIVDYRAFRVSNLFGATYHVLAMCLSGVGLKDFIVSFAFLFAMSLL